MTGMVWPEAENSDDVRAWSTSKGLAGEPPMVCGILGHSARLPPMTFLQTIRGSSSLFRCCMAAATRLSSANVYIFVKSFFRKR